MTAHIRDSVANNDLDEYERLLIEQIEMLQRAYMKDAEPLVRRLVEIRSLRSAPPLLVTQKQADALVHAGFRLNG